MHNITELLNSESAEDMKFIFFLSDWCPLEEIIIIWYKEEEKKHVEWYKHLVKT